MEGRTRTGSDPGVARFRAGAGATLGALSVLACASAACEVAPHATPAEEPGVAPGEETGAAPAETATAAARPTAAVQVPDVARPSTPAWLAMTPNFRREEASRLASAALAECNERLGLEALRGRLDSLRRHHRIEPADARSDPRTAEALDALLERQRERPACLDASDAYRRSREIVETAPARFELPAHAAPDSASETLGTILIQILVEQAGPEQIAFAYRPRGAAAATAWTLDRMQVDGYGGYYHTMLERRGDWLLLPADPFPAPAWIHWSGTFRSPPEIEPLFGTVYLMRGPEARAAAMAAPTTWDAPGVVYTRSEGRSVWFRLEGPEDGPCPELRTPDQRAALSASGSDEEWALPLEDLFDDRAHLALHVKYGRGC